MKKLLVGLALTLALGCTGMDVKKDVSVCDRVKNMPLPEQAIAADEQQFNDYMYSAGKDIAWKMRMGIDPACVYVNVFVNQDKAALQGEYCADIRDDGLYICENLCLVGADGSVLKESDNRCNKISK